MLLFVDSCGDYYNDPLHKWDFNFNVGVSSANGRFGDNALNFGNTDNRVRKSISNESTLILGCAFKAYNTGFGVGEPMISFYDGTSRQVCLFFSSNGSSSTMYVTRGGTTLATGTIALNWLVYYYLEIKVVIDNSAGSIQTRVDGVTDINISSVDTQATGNAYANVLQLGGDGGGSRQVFISDLVLMNGTSSGISGAPNNAFLGDVRIEALRPNGNGNSSQFVGSDGNSTDNYLLVDDWPADDDTTYVESNTVGDKDTYAYENLTPTSGLVYGVQYAHRARKTDAGTRKFKGVNRLSGTEQDSSEYTLSTSYQPFFDIRDGDPSGNQWTISNVNSMENGQKVTA